MKQHPVLNINIPKPCSQDWAAMPDAGEGKLCSQCNNVVYDFSGMSDDELLNYFKQKPGTHCGRFHNSQLRRDILPAPKPYRILLSRFNKVAAAVFTVLSFKSISSKAQIKTTTPATVFDSSYKFKSRPDTGITTISGTVKDRQGNLLENAKIIFESEQVAVTGKDGKFSFELKIVNLEYEDPNFNSRNIYFSYDSLITSVRTYHYAMFSANFDVILYKEGTGEGSYLGGIIVPSDEYLLGTLPSITFISKSVKLSADAKDMLSSIAYKLKSNPYARIKVQAYPSLRGGQSISNNRIINIRKYLMETEGISPDRIITNFEVGGGNPDVIDIMPAL